MQDLKRLNLLINAAAKKFGSDNQLALALDTTRQTISNWRHGVKDPSVEAQQRLAELAGVDPAPHVFCAAVEKTDNPKAIALLEPFRKVWLFS